MAQWTGQFCGLTHETKVQETELSLRQGLKTFKTMPDAERIGKLKAIRTLAERLLAVRLKAMHARISVLTEPGSKSLDAGTASHLRKRVQELRVLGADDVLREFGFYDKPVA